MTEVKRKRALLKREAKLSYPMVKMPWLLENE
jgi:hypothetical protein